MDALLGAAALGDIGKLFPDSADEFAGISSLEPVSYTHLSGAASAITTDSPRTRTRASR